MKESRLTFIRKSDRVNRHGHKTYSWFKCSCGNVIEAMTTQVKSGNTRSCGCLQKEMLSAIRKVHGMRNHHLYSVWLNMRQRCSNPNVGCYSRYGGRGITVCKEWDSFETFFNDVSAGYAEGLELDRIDGDKGYCPENVQWVPHKVNSQKRTYCKLDYAKAAEIRQSDLPAKELAKLYNVSIPTIRKVLRKQIWI